MCGGGGGVAAATSNSYSQANAVSLSEGWRYGGKERGNDVLTCGLFPIIH